MVYRDESGTYFAVLNDMQEKLDRVDAGYLADETRIEIDDVYHVQACDRTSSLPLIKLCYDKQLTHYSIELYLPAKHLFKYSQLN